VNPDPDAADPSRGIYRIASLYISTALQSAGLGRNVMNEVERMAKKAPFNANILTLGAVANEYEGKKERLEAFGREEPPVSLQDWYTRRGYFVYKIHPNLWSETDKHGNEHWVTHVSMKKNIN
jgi:ribosomal protein S18 acetylase RimI-like enzyme